MFFSLYIDGSGNKFIRILLLTLCLLISACGGSSSSEDSTDSSIVIPTVSSNTSWFLQLQGSYDLSVSTELYELDLFDAQISQISTLKNNGVFVVCYFSAGSFEDWRDDASSFTQSDIGQALDNWPGEYWLDIRSENVRSVLKNRIQLAKSKGCDAVDPDNVDGFLQTTGFNITASDQLAFNSYLANTAHSFGLAIGLKNDLTQIQTLEPLFDFAINEQCIAYQECDYLAPFKTSQKLIVNIEYDTALIESDSTKSALCAEAETMGMMTKVLTNALDGTELYSCF